MSVAAPTPAVIEEGPRTSCFEDRAYCSALYLALHAAGKFELLVTGFDLDTVAHDYFAPLDIAPMDVAYVFLAWVDFAELQGRHFRCSAPPPETVVWVKRWVERFLLDDDLFINLRRFLENGFANKPELRELLVASAPVWRAMPNVHWAGPSSSSSMGRVEPNVSMFSSTVPRRTHALVTHGLLCGLLISGVCFACITLCLCPSQLLPLALSDMGLLNAFPGELWRNGG